MPGSIWELAESRSLRASATNPGATYAYIVVDAADVEEARALTFAASPSVHPQYPFLVRRQINVDPRSRTVYHTTAEYETLDGFPIEGVGGTTPPSNQPATPGLQQALGPEFDFDTTGSSVNVKTSLATIVSVAEVGDAPNYNNAIGVNGDNVEGVDKIQPALTWSVTAKFAFVTFDYWKKVSALTGTVNMYKFFHNDAGECLFLGASGKFSNGEWSVTFRFARSPNVPLLKPADNLPEILNKQGWDYVWIAHREAISEGRRILEPFAAYVERIYERKDFAELQIGGASA